MHAVYRLLTNASQITLCAGCRPFRRKDGKASNIKEVSWVIETPFLAHAAIIPTLHFEVSEK